MSKFCKKFLVGALIGVATTFTVAALAACGGSDASTAATFEEHTHNWGEWETITNATCTTAGLEGRTCSDETHSEVRVIKSLGHDYKGVATQPTCTEQGYTTYTCTRCDDSYDDNYVDSTGHDFQNDICTKCHTQLFAFKLLSNDTYEISGFNKDTKISLTEIVIPATYNGKAVTKIGYNAFSGCNGLKSITIPHSITAIDQGAFSDCSSLTSIEIPSGVTEIAFGVFNDCQSLVSVTLPDSVTSIANRAFYGCTSLKNITIPDGVTSIGSSAFANCSSLTSITIPSSITSIVGRTFDCCASLESVTIPDGVTKIMSYAFANCTSLTSITIPSSVTLIGGSAFGGCTSLAEIVVDENNNNYKTVDGDLYSKDGTQLLQYAIGKKAESFAIPDGVTTIGEYAFSACVSLIGVTIPNSVTAINEGAFLGCTSLTSITIPATVTAIGQSAFSGCTSLTSVEMQNGLTNISEWAFENCTSLASITIPQSVTTICMQAFESCSGLVSVTFENTSGWTCGGSSISSEDLSDTSTAAEYLTSTYRDCYWYCSE